MSIKNHNKILESSLAKIPNDFRAKVISTYLEIKRRSSEAQYDATGLSAGKFCETVIRLLQHEVFNSYIPFGQTINNFADEVKKLVQSPKTAAVESIRIIIPRAILFIYTLRNKRGIGHIGGDVDANKIDTVSIVTATDWVICELIRIYHNLSLEEAQDLIDSISIKELPIIWEVAGKKRILNDKLSSQDKVLILLYSEKDSFVLSEDLCSWIEYSVLAMFKKRVLEPLHKKKFIEFDRENDCVYLSPLGVKQAEKLINSI